MIRLSRSSVGSAEKDAISKVLDKGFLGFGPESFAFEAELATFFGQDVAVTGSGTAGLHLALQSLGVGPGDEVIVPTITYVATFMAVSATGAKPIPAGVNESFLLDPKEIKRLFNSRTKCVLPVLYAGLSSNLEEIYQTCVGIGVDLVVDAAHAFGQDYDLGSSLPIRVLHCYSFDGIKNITSGEGGAVLSNDHHSLAHIASARLLGVEHDSHARKEGGRTWYPEVNYQGWRYHMSDVMAAIGRSQLKKTDEFFKKRRRLASQYIKLLKPIRGIKPVIKDPTSLVPHIFPCLTTNEEDVLKIRNYLHNQNIQTGFHYYPNHKTRFFASSDPELKRSEMLASRQITLPLHTELSSENVNYIVDSLNTALNR